ncbi:MAG: peptidylprolyl isomerase [Kofleriaceae bacterium]
MNTNVIALVIGLAVAPACGGGDAAPVIPDGPPGDVVTYNMMTSKGLITLETHHSWAPNGVDRFADLVASGFYTDARFFRVIDGFVAQFGINGTPATDAMWSSRTISDDPVARSNVRGYLTFAQTSAPDSRTTQLFINLVDNSFLDNMGFAPFAVVTAGMDVADQLDSEYGEMPDQDMISATGNSYLAANFPNLDYVIAIAP